MSSVSTALLILFIIYKPVLNKRDTEIVKYNMKTALVVGNGPSVNAYHVQFQDPTGWSYPLPKNKLAVRQILANARKYLQTGAGQNG